MSHFADEVWADLARGSLSPSEAEAVARHVEAGCSVCSRALRTWESLTEVLHREASYEPPADVLARARSVFSPAAEEPESAGAARIAEIIFDSFASPAPAGLRSVERSTRQLCFKTGDFYVDLRIEEHTGSPNASVLGQLMRVPHDERVRLDGVSVVLSSGVTSLESTTTNRLGEFQLEVPIEGDHNIAVGIGDGFAMIVPLRSLRRRSQGRNQ